ncbi:MAG: ABC transporter permease [Clostridium sp.]|nr:ABC transporter permease [Clostridium sp.]MCM1460257.1 ABC transporter permease [Bacteroides sp.]
MKGVFREMFRYKISGMAMLICLVVSMFAAYYGITIYKNVFFEYMDKNEYKYKSETHFIYAPDESGTFPSVPKDSHVNLKIKNCSAYADTSRETIIIDVVLHSYQENYPLQSGHYPDVGEQEEQVVVLGRERMEDAYERDNEAYYSLFGEEYKVVGVIGSKNSVYFDTCVFVYGMGDEMRQRLASTAEMGYSMVLESNDCDTRQVYDEFIGVTEAVVSNKVEDFTNSTAEPIYGEKLYCIIIFLFSFICIAVVISFWMNQRTHELQVCRACGFTNSMIVKRIFKSLLLLCLFAFCIFACLAVGVNFLLGSVSKEYNLGFSVTIILPYIGVFAVALIVVCIIPIAGMLHTGIAASLNRKE